MEHKITIYQMLFIFRKTSLAQNICIFPSVFAKSQTKHTLNTLKPHHCEVPKDLKLEVTQLLSSSQKVNDPLVGWKIFQLAFACLVIGRRGSVIRNLRLNTMPPHLSPIYIYMLHANSHFNDFNIVG
ncbi:hypothetical protein BT93_C2292 [Corymbia citriodora subsp. variegata]|nr:hypothetical protein BT93_C2292 [Corymbia citriodora subsp. variegata]